MMQATCVPVENCSSSNCFVASAASCAAHARCSCVSPPPPPLLEEKEGGAAVARRKEASEGKCACILTSPNTSLKVINSGQTEDQNQQARQLTTFDEKTGDCEDGVN
jgi:hypothetical protein